MPRVIFSKVDFFEISLQFLIINIVSAERQGLLVSLLLL